MVWLMRGMWARGGSLRGERGCGKQSLRGREVGGLEWTGLNWTTWVGCEEGSVRMFCSAGVELCAWRHMEPAISATRFSFVARTHALT